LISSNGGSGTVPVTMEVSTQPQLAVTPTRLDFSMTTTSRVFQISNVGFGTLEWTVSTNTSWVEIVPPLSGTGDKYLTVNVNPANVPAGGQQYGYVYVASNGGDAHVEIVYTPPGPTFGGTIGVYSMADGADCNIHDLAPGLLKVYVVHTGIVAATASQFFAPMPSCMTGAAWLSDDPQFPVALGNSQTGIAIAYGGCMPSPIHILTINYFAGGTTQECCYYPVLPDPSVVSGQIEVVNCDEHLVYADGLVSVVNPVMGCYCGVIKVKETTWGKVKSLYAPSSDQINRR
jgi:hypothetical protein